MRLPADVAIVPTVDGEWIVIVSGVQWAPAGQPRDRSGCGRATYPTKNAARKAFLEQEAKWTTCPCI